MVMNGKLTPLCTAGPSSPSPLAAPPCWCFRCRCCRTPGTRPSRRPSGRSCSWGSPAPPPGSPSYSSPRPSRNQPAQHMAVWGAGAKSWDSWPTCCIREARGPGTCPTTHDPHKEAFVTHSSQSGVWNFWKSKADFNRTSRQTISCLLKESFLGQILRV